MISNENNKVVPSPNESPEKYLLIKSRLVNKVYFAHENWLNNIVIEFPANKRVIDNPMDKEIFLKTEL